MKKTVLSLMFVALSVMAFAQQWTSLGKSNPAGPEVKLVSSSEQKVVVDFTLGGFNLTRVSTPNGIQQVVTVPKMASMLEAGAPDLPHFPVSAIIGDMAEMEVSVTKCDYTDFENIEIAPSKGNFSRQINPDDVPYTYGEMYSQNAFYPATQATLEAPYIIRDYRGQNIMVAPFAYNPVTKTLRVYHHLTIAMTKVSDNGVNQKVGRKANQKMSSDMKAAYEHRFINFKESSAKYTFDEDLGEMIIICPDMYMDAMQPFVDWKNQSGRPTSIVSLSEVGGNNDTQIKNYIQNIYNDPNRNLEFILLVGDYADLTPHSMSGGRSDNWFGQLEGNDYYLEALTGRFSVESVQHVENHVNKVLYYERDMPEGLTWVNKGVGIGASEGAGHGHNGGEADYVHMNYIRDTLMHYSYESVSQQYSGVGAGTSAAAISADLNNGASIVNYCNHGSQTGWAVAGYSMSHVNALVNDNMWPFVWSVACDVGRFQGSCFAEAWMRATNNSTNAPTGAVAGMFSWISQPWIPPMTGQDEMVDILTEWKNSDQFNHTMGGASLNGTMYILDMHPGDAGETHNTWLLFGDPSLMLRTDNPVSMNVTCSPSSLMIGLDGLEIAAVNTDYGIATLMMDGEVLATGKIQNGICNLTFAPLSTIGTATLTVMGYNKVTEIIELAINPNEGPYITVSGYEPNFAPVNQETVFSLSFKNVGVDPTSAITNVTLTCDDERLQIINGTAEIGIMAANEEVTLTDAFSFIIAEGVEDGTKFHININMECGSTSWSGKATVTAQQAVLKYAGVNWYGGLVPGATVSMAVNFANMGHYLATNAVASIACENEYVTLINESVEVGTIDPEGMAVCNFSALIDETCPETEKIQFNFTIVADGGLTAEGSAVLKNDCMIVFDLNDSFGDGWNGNKLIVSFDDDTPQQELTLEDGSHESVYMEIGRGTTVTLRWVNGSYSYECSFTVRYDGGDVIYQGNNLSSGVLYEFVCECEGGAIIDYAPVENLMVSVDVESLTLQWDAPEGAIGYAISRNGVEIGTTEENTYVDQVDTEGSYAYCVVAKYEGGTSQPECIVVEAEWGIDENESGFAIYPNPVSNTLYIHGGDAQYSYEMFNGMGQMVADGNGQGTVQISVNDLKKGVYFLRLTNGTQVSVQKIVVE